MDFRSEDMLSVPIQNFVAGVQINVDMYVRLSKEKFVLVFRAGAPLDLERIQDFHRRNLTHIYIHKDVFPKFMERQLTVAGIVIDYHKAPVEYKTTFINNVVELLLEEFEKIGFTGETFDSAKHTANTLVHLVNSEPMLYKLLDKLNKTDDQILKHSAACAITAVMIGRAQGWTRPETLEKLALGGILHDIGKQELSPELLRKPRFEMSYEELKDYESHAFRGLQILQSVSVVPSDILAIVYEHHENSIGQGFPRRLWDMRITPMARIVALADCFSTLVIPTAAAGRGAMTPIDAQEYIERVLGQPFNKDAFKALKSLLSPVPAKGATSFGKRAA